MLYNKTIVEDIGRKCNSVSEKVAVDMATAVTRLFSSDYGIGITGYATTKPEAGINELFAQVAVVFKGETLIASKIIPTVTDSLEVQIDYVNQVLEALNKSLVM